MDLSFSRTLCGEDDAQRARFLDIIGRIRPVGDHCCVDPDPNKVKVTDPTTLARCTEAVHFEKNGPDMARQVDQLLNQCISLDPEGPKYNRQWLANQLGMKPGDLSKALQPNAPIASYNNAAARAIRLLNNRVKQLSRNK